MSDDREATLALVGMLVVCVVGGLVAVYFLIGGP